jgi:hypothetical protein
MNKVIGFSIFGLLVYGAIRIAKVNSVAEQITTTLIKPRIHKVSFSGMTFRSEVEINNPTPGSISLSKPVITLTSKGKKLTQSRSEDKVVTIEPLSVTNMDTIELEVGWTVLGTYITGIIKKIPDLISAYKSGNLNNLAKVMGIPLEMTFSTYSNGIFYQSTPTKIL